MKKPFIKASIFLVFLTLLDFILRQGFIGFLIPFPLPSNFVALVLYASFTLAAWFVTRWFCRREKTTLNNLGISFNQKNRNDFLIGFIVGVILWAIVSITQSITAGFSWELRPEISLFNMLYGLLFIFIADLGTELFTRGYPLTRFKDSFGSIGAISIMTVFVGLKSINLNCSEALLFYTILIPALHTIFFSIIYFKTKRLGAAVGLHTGANFITISIFDLRIEQPGQAIPAGFFQPSVEIDSLSLNYLQLPWVIMAIFFSITVYFWWIRGMSSSEII